MKNDIKNKKIDKNLIGIEEDIITIQCFDRLRTKGRPKYKLNNIGINIIDKLSNLYCTKEEISYILGVDISVLENSVNKDIFNDAYKKGCEGGKVRLRKAQFDLAKRSHTMAIWLGKQYLGQKDLPDGGNAVNPDGTVKNANELKIVVEKRVVDLSATPEELSTLEEQGGNNGG